VISGDSQDLVGAISWPVIPAAKGTGRATTRWEKRFKFFHSFPRFCNIHVSLWSINSWK